MDNQPQPSPSDPIDNNASTPNAESVPTPSIASPLTPPATVQPPTPQDPPAPIVTSPNNIPTSDPTPSSPFQPTLTQPTLGAPPPGMNQPSRKSRQMLALVAIIIFVVAIGGVYALLQGHKPAKTITVSTKTSNPVSQLATNRTDSQAKQQLLIIDSDLQLYNSNNEGHYPATLTDVIGEPGASPPPTKASLTPPSGVKFTYTPLPSGCTTAGQNCHEFTLEAVSTSGRAIDTLKSDD